MKNRGEWYQVYVDGKPATEGSTFSAVERAEDGSVRTHDFIIGEDGRVFHVDTSKPQNKGEQVDPRVVKLKVENGSVEFINEPTPEPPTSPRPTPSPTTPPDDGRTPPGDDSDDQEPPRPNPPIDEPPVTEPPANEPPEQIPPGEGERQPGERPDGQDGQGGDQDGQGGDQDGPDGQQKPDDKNKDGEDKDGDGAPDANDRIQDPDTGNGTVPGQAGADWAPGNSGDEQTRAPDYSDPVPRNPDDAGEESQDVIAGPEPSHENHTSASAEPSKSGKAKKADSASDEDGSFPWSLAVLLGAGVIGLLLAVFIFARRKSEE